MLFQESRDTLSVIPHLMRNPEIPGQGIPAKAIPTRGPALDPASLCGVTRYDAVSRNTVCGTCPLRPLSGPRIVVRGDTERIVVRGDPSGMWNLQRGICIVRISGFPRGNLRFFHRDALVAERYVVGVGIACCVEIGCGCLRQFQCGFVALSVVRHAQVKRNGHSLR